MPYGGPLEGDSPGDGSARRIGDKHKAVVEKQGQAWPISWCDAVIGCQWSVGVCVERLKPRLEGTKELAKPLKQTQDLVQRSTMDTASRQGFLEQALKLETLV